MEEEEIKMKFLVLKKETAIFILISGIILATVSAWFLLKKGDTVVFNAKNGQFVKIIMKHPKAQ
jgi:hypothetical protein